MEFKEGICKFCLKKCESCKTVEENMKNVLCTFQPKMDFGIIPGQVICRNCAKMLIECFDFKAKCLHTYKSLVPLVNKNSIQLDLKDVYLNKNVTVAGIPDDQNICGFCMGLVKNVFAISLEDGGVMLEKMLKRCLPELDLSIVKRPVICTSCRGSLEDCFRFVTNCLNAVCCETLDLDSKDEINLNNVLERSIGDIKSEVDNNSVKKIKVEQFCWDRGSPDEREIEHRSDIIKLEETFFEDCARDDQEADNELEFTPRNMLALEEQIDRPDFVKIKALYCEGNEAEHREETLVEMEDQKFLHTEIEIKTEENRFEYGIVLPQQEVTSLIPNLKEDPTKSHIKQNLTNQSASSITMYKCDFCLYQTKFKSDLKTHSLTHKDVSEVTMYKCDVCLYETKFKKNLKPHLLTHKNPLEVKMYSCDSCLYQTKFKQALNRHLLKHKDPSEVTMYNCDSCSFQTKFKKDLRIHWQKHGDPAEVIIYKCDFCSYQTKYKTVLKRHFLKHENPSDLPMYQCDSCSYQTKFKGDFNTHLLKHKDVSEITMYKCDVCSYKTRFKKNLKPHLLRHKDPLEVQMYDCEFCLYQTKYKQTLKRHLLKHKSPSEATMYKCNSCLFQTKYQYSINIHLLKHKQPSEVTMYNCDSCSFQTNFKNKLTLHLQKHRDPPEVISYKCDYCSYQTKYKSDLKRHVLKHNIVELTM